MSNDNFTVLKKGMASCPDQISLYTTKFFGSTKARTAQLSIPISPINKTKVFESKTPNDQFLA